MVLWTSVHESGSSGRSFRSASATAWISASRALTFSEASSSSGTGRGTSVPSSVHSRADLLQPVPEGRGRLAVFPVVALDGLAVSLRHLEARVVQHRLDPPAGYARLAQVHLPLVPGEGLQVLQRIALDAGADRPAGRRRGGPPAGRRGAAGPARSRGCRTGPSGASTPRARRRCSGRHASRGRCPRPPSPRP